MGKIITFVTDRQTAPIIYKKKSNASLLLTITSTAVDTIMRHCMYGGNRNRNKAIKDILDKTTQLKIGNQNVHCNQGHIEFDHQ